MRPAAFRVWLRLGVLVAAFWWGAPAGRAATGILALDEPSPTVRFPARVMIDAITQAGGRLVAAGEHGVVIYSDDSGASWLQARVPVDATLTSVGFADPADGWATGNFGVILHTTDGGATWRLQLNGFQADQLTLQAAQSAVAAHIQSPGAPRAIARAKHLIAQDDPKPFLSIWVQNARRAIVFGAYRLAMVTNDAGKTWTDCSLSIADAFSHHLYGAAQVGTDIYVVGEAGLVFRSRDAGVSFPQAAPAGDVTLFGVLGTGDGGVLVYGVAGAAFRSGDGGASWVPVNLPANASITGALMLASGAILLTAESGTLYISHDHGASFTALPTRVPMAVYAALQAPDGALILAGSDGVIKLRL